MDKMLVLEVFKKRASETYFSEMKAEEILDDLTVQFSDFANGFAYINDMDYLANAVMFYMIHSKESALVKEKVQGVFEKVIANDYNLKKYQDIVSIISDTLDELHETKNKDSTEQVRKGA